MSDRWRAVYGQLLAVLFALAIGAIIILMVDESPIKVFMTLLRGAFGDQAKIAGTLLQTTPILICGVAACIGLRGGMFNVGIEGQLFLGGFAAAWVGFALPLPAGIHMLVGLAVATLAGAWLRLSRVADAFTAYTSTDGTTWNQVGAVTVTMPSAIPVGLVTAAGAKKGPAATAQFREFGDVVTG
jgi:hypothetical protein